MKTALLTFLLWACTASALALDRAELDKRIGKLAAKFEALQQRPDKRIPAETLRKAQGIAMLDRTKAGFIFAYQGGSGVAMVKDPKSGRWGPAAFLSANEASVGFLIGGQQSFVVMVFMSTNATHLLTEPAGHFGGEARGTAGEASAGAEGDVASREGSVLVYDDRKGLYGGAAIQGGAIAPDDEANRIYYGEALTIGEVLFGRKVKATEAAVKLAEKIDQHSKGASK